MLIAAGTETQTIHLEINIVKFYCILWKLVHLVHFYISRR